MKIRILAGILALLSTAGPVAAAPCDIREVASAPGENHVMFHGVSPDGRTLAVGWDKGDGASTTRGAYLLDLASGKRTALSGLNNAPSFSLDGRFLVSANYSPDRSLRTEVVELDRPSGKTRTFASGHSGEWLASYSADGKWILFNSTRTGASDLFRVRRSNGFLERLTTDPRYEAHAHYFDRDSKLIFHRQTEGDNYDIVVRDMRSGAERLVGATPAEESYPAMSPDGKWIAFSAVTKPNEQPHLFVMARDGSRRRQLTSDSAKDGYATWAPNGSDLYFVRFASAGSRVLGMKLHNGKCLG